MKRGIVVIIIIVGILAIGAGVYFAWLKSNEILNPPSNTGTLPAVRYAGGGQRTATTTTAAATTAAATPTVFSDKPAFDYWVVRRGAALGTSTLSGDAVFYMAEDGELYRGRDSGDELISSRQFSDLVSLAATHDGKFAAVSSGGQNDALEFDLFSLDAKTWQALPNVVAVAFSPDSKKIAYLERSAQDASRVTLVIKDLTGKKPATSRVVTLALSDAALQWPSINTILFVPRPSANVSDTIMAFDLRARTFSLFAFGQGLAVAWSDNGSLGLKFDSGNGHTPTLTLIDADGALVGTLGFTTLPSKCAIAPPQLYCGVPASHTSTEEPALPDAYLMHHTYFTDTLSLIDLGVNTITPFASAGGRAIDADHLMLGASRLFFINRYDKRVYGARL